MLDPTATNYYAACLKLGLAAGAARYSDAVDIQAQGSITDLTKYSVEFSAAFSAVRPYVDGYWVNIRRRPSRDAHR